MKKHTILIKENGKIIKNKTESKVFMQDHLCSTCAYANPLACQKVADIFINSPGELKEKKYREKQPIGEYPEITDGYQILDEKNIVQRFVVTGCANYKFKDKNESSEIKIEDLNRARELLMYLYAYCVNKREEEINNIRKKLEKK